MNFGLIVKSVVVLLVLFGNINGGLDMFLMGLGLIKCFEKFMLMVVVVVIGIFENGNFVILGL